MLNPINVNVVWLKRDLRLSDHQPLCHSIETGVPTALIYIFEPIVAQHPDWDIRHWQFVYHSILDLNARCESSVQIFYGNAEEVFDCINDHTKIGHVFSHEETGTRATFDRDIQMAKWFDSKNIKWHETPTGGVVRKLKSRKLLPKIWHSRMEAPFSEPNLEKATFVKFDIPARFQLPKILKEQLLIYPTAFQPAGETYAWRYLNSFFKDRYSKYNRLISKPEESRKSCSRLSPYLAWGNLSMKQVVQATKRKSKESGTNKVALASFYSRLHWHCHFIQKFESECRMEFEPVNTAYLSLEKPRIETYIKAWQNGQTGTPLIDACMRCVKQTGYLNFRMRAMVVSFYSYNMWQPWQEGAYYLARMFLDYEPGIHFPQFQMQTGITGINMLRIYNPIQNALKHDPDGVFTRKWVPEIAHLPDEFIHEPWKITDLEAEMYHFKLGENYPFPILNLEETRKYASTIMWESKKTTEVQTENQRILKRHTHRKKESDQMTVNFDQLNNEEKI